MDEAKLKADVLVILEYIHADIFENLEVNPGEDEAYLDVRLRVHDGSFGVLQGDSSYDQDHRGFWGSSSLAVDSDLEDIAADLVEQVLDDQAQNESQSDSAITDILEKGI